MHTKDVNSAIVFFHWGCLKLALWTFCLFKYCEIQEYWQLQPCSGTLSYSVSLCFCMNQKKFTSFNAVLALPL